MPFQYTGYRNPYVADIASTMMEPGRIAAQELSTIAAANARAAEIKGQAYGQAAQNIGTAVGQGLELQRAQNFEKQVNGIVNGLMTNNPDGSMDIDRQKLQQAFAAHNVPLGLQRAVGNNLDDLEKSMTAFRERQRDARADIAHGALESIDNGADPANALAMAIAIAKGSSAATDKQLIPFMALGAAGDPDQIKSGLTQLRAQSEKYKEYGRPIILPRPGAEAITTSGKVLATAGQPTTYKPEPSVVYKDSEGTEHPVFATSDGRFVYRPTPNPNDQVDVTNKVTRASTNVGKKDLQQKEVVLDGKTNTLVQYDPDPGAKTHYYDLDGKVIENASSRIRAMPTGTQITLASGQLSKDALEEAAQRYLVDGTLPTRIAPSQRAAIMNRAAVINPMAALATNAAVYKADAANLLNLQRTEGALSAFEKAAGKNLDQFESLAKTVPDTGVPWLNTPIRDLDRNVVGSNTYAAIVAARDIALREVARVTNDPKMMNALTDAARKEVQDLIPENATWGQIKTVITVLRQDMKNVHAGLFEQINDVKQNIGVNPATPKGALGVTQPPAGGPPKADPGGIRTP